MMMITCCLYDREDDDPKNHGDGDSNDETHLGEKSCSADDTTNKGNYITFISFHLHKFKEVLDMCLIQGAHFRNLPHVLSDLFSSSILRNEKA